MAPSIGDLGPPLLPPVLRAIKEQTLAPATAKAAAVPQPLKHEAGPPAPSKPDAPFAGVVDRAFVDKLQANLSSIADSARHLEKSLTESRGVVSQKLLEIADELLKVYAIMAAVATAAGNEGAAQVLAEQADVLAARGPRAVKEARAGTESSAGGADRTEASGEAADSRAADLHKLASSVANSARVIAGLAERAAEEADDGDRRDAAHAADGLRSSADAIEKAALPDRQARAGPDRGENAGPAASVRTPSAPPTLVSTRV